MSYRIFPISFPSQEQINCLVAVVVGWFGLCVWGFFPGEFIEMPHTPFFLQNLALLCIAA